MASFTERESYYYDSYTCPSGYDCMYQNSCPSIEGTECPPGWFCNIGGTRGGEQSMADYFQAYPCSPYNKEGGYYCPDTLTETVCASGTWCGYLRTKETKCEAGMICGEAATYPVSYLLLVVALVYFMLWMACSLMCFRKKRGSSRAVTVSSETQGASGTGKSAAATLGTATPLSFSFKDLSLTLGGKTLLEQVSGSVEAGEMVAVMGPSGAGKTTFMNAIMGKFPNTTGSVLINGSKLSFSQIRSLTGMVPQNDTMMSAMTVRENLQHSADTRSRLPWSARSQRVDAVIDILGLTHVADVVVGNETRRGISGGERKRVSIGMELCANPSALFLDEPTTGLDTTAADVVVRTLRRLADEGHTIVAVLHQPRFAAFELFDKILVLAHGGLPVYFGSPKKASSFLSELGIPCPSRKNPADHLIDAASGRKGISTAQMRSGMVTWAEGNALKDEGKDTEMPNPLKARRELPWCGAQLYYFWRRSCLLQLRARGSLYLYTGLVVLMIASLASGFSPHIQDSLAGLYRPPLAEVLRAYCPPFMEDSCKGILQMDGLEQMLYFFSMGLGCVGMIAGTRSFSRESLLVLRREGGVGISIYAAAAGQMIADLSIVAMLAFMSMGLWTIMGFPGGQLRWLSIGFAVFFAGFGWGYSVSQLVPFDARMTAVMIVGVITSAFNGVNPSLKTVNSIPVARWFWAISHARWIGEAIHFCMTNDYAESGVAVAHGAAQIGYVVTADQFTLDIVITIILGIALRGLALVLISQKLVGNSFCRCRKQA